MVSHCCNIRFDLRWRATCSMVERIGGHGGNMKDRVQMFERKDHGGFTERYGSWALIAGASEGIGAAFAQALAGRGMNLVLVARREVLLDRLAEDLHARYGAESRCIAGDLGDPGFLEKLGSSMNKIEPGMLVYNAAYSPIGDFAGMAAPDLMRVVDVNVRGPLTLLNMVLPFMSRRRKGGIVLMSSLAGNQGTPRIAAYAASKSFNRVLAEGLWYELKEQGIDIIACFAGAVRTPGYVDAAHKDAPGTLDPGILVEKTLAALGHGPLVVPGVVNQMAYWIMGRLLPRTTAIRIMAGSTKDLVASSKADH